LIVVSCQLCNFSVIPWQEQVNVQWDDYSMQKTKQKADVNWSQHQNIWNHIGDVMVSVLAECGRSWVESPVRSNQRL
jgi:hypothetical protein